MPDICEVSKSHSISFNFAKTLQDRHFVVDELKSFKLLPDISFDSGFQEIVFSSLLLYLYICVYLCVCICAFVCICVFVIKLIQEVINETKQQVRRPIISTIVRRSIISKIVRRPIISTIVPRPIISKYNKAFPKYLTYYKLKMSGIFVFEERAADTTQNLPLFKGSLFRNGRLY